MELKMRNMGVLTLQLLMPSSEPFVDEVIPPNVFFCPDMAFEPSNPLVPPVHAPSSR